MTDPLDKLLVLGLLNAWGHLAEAVDPAAGVFPDAQLPWIRATRVVDAVFNARVTKPEDGLWAPHGPITDAAALKLWGEVEHSVDMLFKEKRDPMPQDIDTLMRVTDAMARVKLTGLPRAPTPQQLWTINGTWREISRCYDDRTYDAMFPENESDKDLALRTIAAVQAATYEAKWGFKAADHDMVMQAWLELTTCIEEFLGAPCTMPFGAKDTVAGRIASVYQIMKQSAPSSKFVYASMQPYSFPRCESIVKLWCRIEQIINKRSIVYSINELYATTVDRLRCAMRRNGPPAWTWTGDLAKEKLIFTLWKDMVAQIGQLMGSDPHVSCNMETISWVEGYMARTAPPPPPTTVPRIPVKMGPEPAPIVEAVKVAPAPVVDANRFALVDHKAERILANMKATRTPITCIPGHILTPESDMDAVRTAVKAAIVLLSPEPAPEPVTVAPPTPPAPEVITAAPPTPTPTPPAPEPPADDAVRNRLIARGAAALVMKTLKERQQNVTTIYGKVLTPASDMETILDALTETAPVAEPPPPAPVVPEPPAPESLRFMQTPSPELELEPTVVEPTPPPEPEPTVVAPAPEPIVALPTPSPPLADEELLAAPFLSQLDPSLHLEWRVYFTQGCARPNELPPSCGWRLRPMYKAIEDIVREHGYLVPETVDAADYIPALRFYSSTVLQHNMDLCDLVMGMATVRAQGLNEHVREVPLVDAALTARLADSTWPQLARLSEERVSDKEAKALLQWCGDVGREAKRARV